MACVSLFRIVCWLRDSSLCIRQVAAPVYHPWQRFEISDQSILFFVYSLFF